jgi:microcystin-dependent protein
MGFSGTNITSCNSPTIGNDKSTFSGVFDTTMQKIDEHNHTTGKGLPIPTGGLQDEAVTAVKIAAAARLPVGMVVPYAGSSAPTGWLLCYGQAVSRVTYADLFTAISTTYGTGDGSTTFNLPDLRGRVAAGKDDMGGSAASRITNSESSITGTTLGAAGGAESVTLSAAQSGTTAHTHSITDPGHTHQYTVTGDVGTDATARQGNSVSSGNGNTQSGVTGISVVAASAASAASSHSSVQPTIILNYIIKY